MNLLLLSCQLHRKSWSVTITSMEITSNQKYNQFLKGADLTLNSSFPLTTHITRHIVCTVALGQSICATIYTDGNLTMFTCQEIICKR